MRHVILLLLALVFSVVHMAEEINTPINSCHRKIILAGGGELPENIKTCFVNFAGGKNAHILIIPSASEQTEKYPGLINEWKNAASVNILHAKNKTEANSLQFLNKIRNATGIWFTGGDQKRLIELYSDTLVIRELKLLLDRGGVVGGTSAGASIIGQIMPYYDGEMIGFGLVDNFIIDQHFSSRNRNQRLKKLIEKYPYMIGVGIDEGTALIIQNNEYRTIGSGNVTHEVKAAFH